MNHLRWALFWGCMLLAVVLVASCHESSAGQQGSETNWFGQCGSRTRCATGTCICGICTIPCTGSHECAEGVCLATGSAAHRALCGGLANATPALCVARCDGPTSCSAGMRCTDGGCIPTLSADAGPDVMPRAPDGALESRARCVVPAMSTSDEALAAIECQFGLPPAAFLGDVRSNANGAMSLDGRSPDWLFIYVDSAARVVHSFEVSGGGVTESITPDDPGGFDCGNTPLTVLSSSRVTPDAMRRLPTVATYDYVDRFLLQRLPCFGGAGTPVLSYVMILGINHTDSGKDLNAWWFAHYDQMGAFQTLCGPCPTNEVLACTTCAPGGTRGDAG